MLPDPLTRRDLLRIGSAGLVASLTACTGSPPAGAEPEPRKGRLGARPEPKRSSMLATGSHPLGLGQERDGLLLVPACAAHAPLPLVVMLHGAGGRATRAVRVLEGLAEEAGFLVLCPESRGRTWDAITTEFGPDIEFINRALAQTFARCAVDSRRVAVAGFSDGATYGLALARANGDLFSHGIAFSPGFLLPVTPRGSPGLFLSHGVHDDILPIEQASRPMVTELRKEGYHVVYREFDGGHAAPPAIAREAVGWYLDASNFPVSRVISGCPTT